MIAPADAAAQSVDRGGFGGPRRPATAPQLQDLPPIPPELVALLRWHLGEFGTASDGRLFRQPNGRIVGSSTYSQVWQAAREMAFTPAQVVSPLAGRPYDLRHAAVSLWLNAGVPAPTVARRAGHLMEVLLRVYANCIDGDEVMANQRISGALG